MVTQAHTIRVQAIQDTIPAALIIMDMAATIQGTATIMDMAAIIQATAITTAMEVIIRDTAIIMAKALSARDNKIQLAGFYCPVMRDKAKLKRFVLRKRQDYSCLFVFLMGKIHEFSL